MMPHVKPYRFLFFFTFLLYSSASIFVSPSKLMSIYIFRNFDTEMTYLCDRILPPNLPKLQNTFLYNVTIINDNELFHCSKYHYNKV